MKISHSKVQISGYEWLICEGVRKLFLMNALTPNASKPWIVETLHRRYQGSIVRSEFGFRGGFLVTIQQSHIV